MLPIEGIPNILNFKGLHIASINVMFSLGGTKLINVVFGNYRGNYEYGIVS